MYSVNCALSTICSVKISNFSTSSSITLFAALISVISNFTRFIFCHNCSIRLLVAKNNSKYSFGRPGKWYFSIVRFILRKSNSKTSNPSRIAFSWLRKSDNVLTKSVWSSSMLFNLSRTSS